MANISAERLTEGVDVAIRNACGLLRLAPHKLEEKSHEPVRNEVSSDLSRTPGASPG